jgi:UDP-N-acetylglucosamine--N-acetylmuramyl-(pentapeptide) pyrophosphoryl-undecaprenol N-acetylglucosamine transferase
MHPGIEMLFVGGEGPEGQLARKAGLEFRGLPVRGMLGRGLHAIPAAMRMGVSLFTSLAIVRSFKPQVVAGFGGYAGFCPVLAAWMLRVPTAVHEQNSVPGVTNRILGRVVDKVMVAYPDFTRSFPSGKVLLTGNPVRPEIAGSVRTKPSRVVPSRVLVLGGSQGARAVNRVVVTAWPRLAEAGCELWHQTGSTDYESVANLYRGLAAVLVPFPHATHDHQSVNASYLEKAGAAVVISEKDLNAQGLAGTVLGLLGDADKLRAMGEAALSQGKPQAARVIAEELTRLAA